MRAIICLALACAPLAGCGCDNTASGTHCVSRPAGLPYGKTVQLRDACGNDFFVTKGLFSFDIASTAPRPCDKDGFKP